MFKKLLKRCLFFLNLILRYLDYCFAKKPKAIFSPLFIIGAPRSGTTLTYQIITQQFKVAYFNHLMALFYGMPNIIIHLSNLFISNKKINYDSYHGCIKGALSPSESANYWFQWFPYDGKLGHYVNSNKINLSHYQSLLNSINSITTTAQSPIVFKSLYLGMVTGVLARIFPTAKFIFVRRELLMICQSLYIARMKQKNPNNWWSIKVPHYRSLLSEPIWKQVVEQVFFTEKIIEDDLKKHAKGRYIEVNYKNFCLNTQETLQSIENLVGDDYEERNNSKPTSFTLSEERILSDDMLNKMSTHLDYLIVHQENLFLEIMKA